MSTPGQKHVLVVDDEEDIRHLIAVVLETEGYLVALAGDGLQALEEVSNLMPDLILLDMRMPVMHGWDFAREFHSRYDDRVPIIVVTAAADAHHRAKEINAKGYLGKPFDVVELARVVRTHIAA